MADNYKKYGNVYAEDPQKQQRYLSIEVSEFKDQSNSCKSDRSQRKNKQKGKSSFLDQVLFLLK